MILFCGHIARVHPMANPLCAVCRYEVGEVPKFRVAHDPDGIIYRPKSCS
jgi:hypothetical protein